MAADYVREESNGDAILRDGVRTFAPHSRKTLALIVIPGVQRLGHLPIIVDRVTVRPEHYATSDALAPNAAETPALIVEVDSDGMAWPSIAVLGTSPQTGGRLTGGGVLLSEQRLTQVG
jgi:3-deoxy-D-arabino-heptulosonate 7-phosphate (DAHP) synthase